MLAPTTTRTNDPAEMTCEKAARATQEKESFDLTMNAPFKISL